jgi:hypothetical protein
MKEKFYCVGCKQHYELSVHSAQRQPSKGGSFRHSLISECPKGHRVNKLCKKEVYEAYGAETQTSSDLDCDTCGVSGPEREGEPLCSRCISCFECCETNCADYDEEEDWPKHECVTCMEGMDELVAKGQSWSCECCGLLVGTQDDHEGCGSNKNGFVLCHLCETDQCKFVDCEMMVTSEQKKRSRYDSEEGNAPIQDPMELGEMANWTPLDGSEGLKRKRAEGMTVGVGLEALEPTPDEPESGEPMVPADSLMPEGSGHVIGSQSTSHNFTPFHAEGQKYPCDSCNKMVSRSDLKVMMGSYDEDYQVCQDCLTYDAETEVHDAESFIAYPELKDHLVSIMPNKVYDIVELDDGDFEMKVASRNMDEVIAAVSEYQIKEKSESDFAFGKSKTTVAVAAAGIALVGAWLWNKRK